MACEFWAAVESRTLKAYLAPPAVQQSRHCAIVYSAIGATKVAREVEEALEDLMRAGTSSPGAVCIARLQERLRQYTVPLNDLITRFAQRLH